MSNRLYNSLREKLLYQETLDLNDEGVRDLLTDLLNKESKMRPLSIYSEHTCQKCDVTIAEKDEYCYKCGQAIDWEE